MALPSAADQVVIQGFLLDELTGLGDTSATITSQPVPLTGQDASRPLVLDTNDHIYIRTNTRTTRPDAATGYWAILALATNDPDLTAYGGRQITVPSDTARIIEVPYNASTTTVTTAMAAQVNAGRTTPLLVVGDSVRAIWYDQAAGFSAPSPPSGYLTSEQTLSSIESGIDAHDTDPDAHPDIRTLIAAATGAVSSVAGRTGDVTLTKADVGLNNVNNVADASKPVSTATQAALDAAAAAVPEQARDALGAALVAGTNVTITPNDGADTITIAVSVPAAYTDEQAQDAFAALIAAGTHSGISFTYNDAGNAISATVTAQSWSQITGKPTFATVATSGAYTDLSGRPTLATVATSGSYTDLTSKPTIPSVPGDIGAQSADSDLTALAGLDSTTSGAVATDGSGWIKKTYAQFKTALGLTKSDVGLGSVDNTADTAKPVSTAQQTALDAKAAKAANLSDLASASTARTNLGLAAVATSGAYTDLTGTVPQSALPSVALTDFLGAVASQSAMLALTGQRGDWCTRTDLGTDWQLITDDPTQLANWRQHVYPASPVSSVNGRTGSVTGLAEATNVPPNTRQVASGTGLTGGGDLSADRTLAVSYGTTSTTAAVGNDSRITGAAQKSSNLSDLASAPTARTNLGLSTVAATGSYTDLGSKPTLAQVDTTDAPQPLGAATPGVGPGAAAADHVHAVPALGALSGVSTTGATSGQVLGYNGSTWTPTGGPYAASTLITASGTYSAPAAGTYEVSVIGGGGSGGGGGSALTTSGVATQRGGGGGGSGVKQTTRVTLTAAQVVTFTIGAAATGGSAGAANGGAGGTGGQGNSTSATWTGGAVRAAGGSAGAGSAANSTAYVQGGNSGGPSGFQGGTWPGCAATAQFSNQSPGGIDGCATGGGPGGSATTTLGGSGGNGGDPANAQANTGSASGTTAGVAGTAAAANSGGGGGGGGGGAPGGAGGAGGNGSAGYATIRQIA